MSSLPSPEETRVVRPPARRRRGERLRAGAPLTTTLEAIAERIGARPRALAEVLEDERKRGRVQVSTAGQWSIIRSAFEPGTLEALEGLELLAEPPQCRKRGRPMRL